MEGVSLGQLFLGVKCGIAKTIFTTLINKGHFLYNKNNKKSL